MSGLDASCFEGGYEERQIAELKTALEGLAEERLLVKRGAAYALSEDALFISDSVFERIII